MEQGDNLLGRIQKNYHTFSKGQKRLAAYITENYDKAVFLTAARLGREVESVNPPPCGLPPSWDTGDFRSFTGLWRSW